MSKQQVSLEQQVNQWRKDYSLYAKEDLYIINKDTDLITFEFNRMQRRVWMLFRKLMIEGKPIRILCIKDRQIGFTTFVAGFFYWLCTMFPNKNALLAAQDVAAGEGIFGKIKLFYKKAANKPLRKISNRKELYFANPNEDGELGLESKISIDTADSAEIGVSKTLQFVHLSEVAVWEAMGFDVKKRLISLKQSIPQRAGTAIILETTPRGEGYVSEMWADEKNDFIKIFISSVADETYRIELRKEQYFELSTFNEHRYGNEEDEYPLYESEIKFWYPEINWNTLSGLSELHHEVMCRLAWRRKTIDVQCEGDKAAFDQEYPITIEKAFAASGSTVFNIPKLNEIKQYITDFPAIITNYRFFRGNSLAEDDFYESKGGSLRIFRDYEPNFKYIIGGDVGQGAKGGDDSALSCRRIPDLKQIFTFDGVLLPYDFARITFRLAKIYGNAFIGMEVNEKGGFSVVEYLLHTFNYTNIYQREVTLEIDQEKQKKYGWITGKFTKPTMVSDFNEQLLNNEMELIDQKIVAQAKKYVLFTEGTRKGQMGASTGKDDLLVADMICLQMAKFVHLSIPQPKAPYKYTFNWWAEQTNVNEDYIGYNDRGPKDYLN